MATMRKQMEGTPMTSFEFSRLETKPAAQKGKFITTFYLKDPIEYMKGSRRVPDGAGKMTPVEAYGIISITFHSDEWTTEKEELDGKDFDGITKEDDGSGKVVNQLVLDVTENGDVQMRRDTLANFANTRRTELRDERRGGAFAEMEEKKAQYLLKKAAQNTSGTSGAPAGGAAEVKLPESTEVTDPNLVKTE